MGTESGRIEFGFALTVLAQLLFGLGGRGCCMVAGVVFDVFSSRLMISMNSLTNSMKASIISKTVLLTTTLPSDSLFEAHLRQAAKILSSEVEGRSGGEGSGGGMGGFVIESEMPMGFVVQGFWFLYVRLKMKMSSEAYPFGWPGWSVGWCG